MPGNGVKKILIIAYYFPPLGGMGAVRPLKLGKYLARKGHKVFVLTPENGTSEITDDSPSIPLELNIVRSSAFTDKLRRLFGRPTSMAKANSAAPSVSRAGRGRLSQFLRNFLVNWILIPDGKAGWIPSAWSLGKKVMENENIDVVFSTSAPFTDHVIAYLLKGKFGKPWIADFRDLWAQDEYMGKPRLRKIIDGWLEKNILKRADAVTVVSDEHQERFNQSHPVLRGRVWTVPNAFDEEDSPARPVTRSASLTFLHAGTVYGDDRNFETLFLALKQLIDEGKLDRGELAVSFLGLPNRFIANLVSSMGLDDVVKYNGLVTRIDSLRAQAESRVLILSAKGGDDPALRGAVRAKLYEYLFSGTPILAMCDPQSAPAKIVSRTGAGKVVGPGDIDGLKKAILGWRDELRGKGTISCEVTAESLDEFRFSRSADKLEKIIATLV